MERDSFRSVFVDSMPVGKCGPNRPSSFAKVAFLETVDALTGISPT